MPFVPGEIVEEEKAFARFEGGCILCTTIEAELAEGHRVVLADDRAVVVAPFWSGTPVRAARHPPHPRGPPAGLGARRPRRGSAARIRDALGHAGRPARRRRRTTSCSTPRPTTTAASYHWHAHIWPKLVTTAGFEQGTGVLINITPPELAAQELPSAAGGGAPMTIYVSVVIDAPPSAVWAVVEPIERHVDWMADADADPVRDQPASAASGTRIAVDTRIGPFRLTDRMYVVEWIDGAVIGVDHIGHVTGMRPVHAGPVRRRRHAVRLGGRPALPVVAGRPHRRRPQRRPCSSGCGATTSSASRRSWRPADQLTRADHERDPAGHRPRPCSPSLAVTACSSGGGSKGSAAAPTTSTVDRARRAPSSPPGRHHHHPRPEPGRPDVGAHGRRHLRPRPDHHDPAEPGRRRQPGDGVTAGVRAGERGGADDHAAIDAGHDARAARTDVRGGAPAGGDGDPTTFCAAVDRTLPLYFVTLIFAADQSADSSAYEVAVAPALAGPVRSAASSAPSAVAPPFQKWADRTAQAVAALKTAGATDAQVSAFATSYATQVESATSAGGDQSPPDPLQAAAKAGIDSNRRQGGGIGLHRRQRVATTTFNTTFGQALTPVAGRRRTISASATRAPPSCRTSPTDLRRPAPLRFARLLLAPLGNRCSRLPSPTGQAGSAPLRFARLLLAPLGNRCSRMPSPTAKPDRLRSLAGFAPRIGSCVADRPARSAARSRHRLAHG